MIEKKDLAGTVRELRLGKGITARELARRAGVATTTVTHLERREHVPRLQNLVKIAHALGVGVKDLL